MCVGRSGQPATDYDYDAFAEDLYKLVTQLGLGDIALVGFGDGLEAFAADRASHIQELPVSCRTES